MKKILLNFFFHFALGLMLPDHTKLRVFRNSKIDASFHRYRIRNIDEAPCIGLARLHMHSGRCVRTYRHRRAMMPGRYTQ